MFHIKTYDYTNLYSIHDTSDLFFNVFKYLPEVKFVYPNVENWLEKVVIPDLKTSNRLFSCIYVNGNFAGYTILKKSLKQNKICTLQILPKYRRITAGRRLLEFALDIIPNSIITVSSMVLHNYSSILSEFNFTLVNEIQNIYSENSTEYIFRH